MQYLKETRQVIEAFGKNVIAKSRGNLTRKKKIDQGLLYSALNYTIVDNKSGFSIVFNLGKYGAFVDQGVRGADPSIIDRWTANGKKRTGVQKAPLSRFSFKSKYPPIKPLSEWAKRKNFRLRDEKGRFAKGNYKAIGFVLSKFIFAQGIKPTYFFSNPYNIAYARLPDEVTQGFVRDLVTMIKEKYQNKKTDNK